MPKVRFRTATRIGQKIGSNDPLFAKGRHSTSNSLNAQDSDSVVIDIVAANQQSRSKTHAKLA